MMLRRIPGSSTDRSVLTTGGFCWWYVDLVDREGNGAVVIWSFGLPFLPDLGPTAADRPSLNIAIYERGRPVFYTLQEVDADWDGGRFRMGRSEIVVSDGRIDATFDGDLPAGRFRGTLHVEGAPLGGGERGAGVHEWAPQLVGTGSLSLEADGQQFSVEGRAYHDRNSSPIGLRDLGIREWWWGRIALEARDLVFYRLVGTSGEIESHVIGADGPIEPVGRRISAYGLSHAAQMRVGSHTVELGEVLDSSPFYLRVLARIGPHTGFAELVRPDRVGRALQKPFVRMAVQRGSGNSMWLPLFAGPSRGRLARLARWWGT